MTMTTQAGRMSLPVPAFLAGGGTMGALMRARDWAATPLGPPQGWPAGLKAIVRTMLATRHPMFVFWGADLLCLYNDAYAATLGPEKHPAMLGAPGRDYWPETWPTIGPQIEQVMSGGPATWHENQLIPALRNGRVEDIYWTYSYGPIDDEDAPGGVGGVLVLCTETTAQVVAQRRLRSQREMLAAIFERSPAFMALLTGPDHVIEMANSGFRAINPDADLIGRPLADAIPAARDQGYVTLLDQVHASGDAYSAAGVRLTPYGRNGERLAERIGDVIFQPLTRDDGTVSGIFVQGIDVTEERTSLAALHASEARYRTLIEALPQLVWTCLPDGRCIYVSGQCVDYTGLSAEAQLGRTWLKQVIHPDDRTASIAAWTAAVGEQHPYDIEYRLRRHDGAYRWFKARATVVPGADGAPTWFGTCTDIEDIVAAREAMTASETRYRTLAETLPQLVWTCQPDGSCDYLSSQWVTYTGMSEGEQLGLDWLDRVIHPDDRTRTYDHWMGAVAGLHPYDIEYRIRRHDGVYRWFKTRGTRVTGDGDTAYWFGTCTDIEDIVAAREVLSRSREELDALVRQRTTELESAQEALRQSQKLEAMGQLTGGVAHDFNNLLTPILGSLDMLQRRGLGGPREQRLIDGALQSAERAKTLVQRLLAFARRQPLQPRPVDIAALVDEMAGLIRSTAGPRVEVMLALDADMPPASVDANQLEMAILNLALNARDAMAEGGRLTIAARPVSVPGTHRAALRPGDYVHLSVGDTGSGMDEATRLRAIEPFFTTKGIGQGTGLGLSMVHGLAAQSGGALAIDSTPGEGTCIELWLPVAPAEAAAIEADRPVVIDAATAGTALLVDDEALVRTSTAAMLAELGYEVVEAGSAGEALSLLEANGRYDLLVTDHLMPGMTGAELALTVRNRWPDMPALIVSGYAQTGGLAPDLVRLVKPFRRDELARSISACVAAQ